MKINLSNLAQATEQQVFDHVAKHLLKQNAKSLSDAQSGVTYCMYRGENGMMCAAGCLMADDEYRSDWENVAWNELSQLDARIAATPRRVDNLIRNLQLVHDDYLPEFWILSLRDIAHEFNLNTDIIKEFE